MLELHLAVLCWLICELPLLRCLAGRGNVRHSHTWYRWAVPVSRFPSPPPSTFLPPSLPRTRSLSSSRPRRPLSTLPGSPYLDVAQRPPSFAYYYSPWRQPTRHTFTTGLQQQLKGGVHRTVASRCEPLPRFRVPGPRKDAGRYGAPQHEATLQSVLREMVRESASCCCEARTSCQGEHCTHRPYELTLTSLY